jgi:hypothetical protein
MNRFAGDWHTRDDKDRWRVSGPAQGWRQAAPEKVTREDSQASPDGRELVHSRGRITGDIWIADIGK